MTERKFFTSESVTEGHPDKIADQISDAILDNILQKDPLGRVACETVVTTGLVLVAGEISTKCYIDIPRLARQTIKEIGYDDASYGFDHKACCILSCIDEQSPDIAQGVNSNKKKKKKLGAGDQGMMFGYACSDTPELMPLPIIMAHKLTKKLAVLRKNKKLKYLRPDGKSQVTVEYEGDQPKRIDTVVISCQHDPEISHQKIEKDIIEKVIKPVCGKYLDKNTVYFINPTGKFCIGGPPGDCGLTGRKIIVDTYGGMGRHGGGCFSGKDPSKVDRSGAYAARYIAKNIVAAKLASKCEVQISYAIGVSEPVSVLVDTFNTAQVAENKISQAVRKFFPLQPAEIINHFQLRRPIYKQTAAYGHFGRTDLNLPWEKIDQVESLKKFFNL